MDARRHDPKGCVGKHVVKSWYILDLTMNAMSEVQKKQNKTTEDSSLNTEKTTNPKCIAIRNSQSHSS